MTTAIEQHLPGMAPAVIPPEPTAVIALMEKALAAGPEMVAALKELVQMRREMRQEQAALEFAAALANFQQTCPPVPRSTTVKFTTSSGAEVSYKSADFEQIAETIAPAMRANGLSFTFDGKADVNMLTETVTLRHINGHSITSSFTLPTSNKNPGMSDQQKYAAAATFAKRQALMAVLGLSLTDPDPDNGADPTTIDEDQASSLEALITEVGADKGKFLAYMRVKALSDIRAADYPQAVRALEQKRKGK